MQVAMRAAGALTALMLAGCAAVAPNYNTSPEVSQPLQAAKLAPAQVGAFDAAPGANNTSITLRASTMQPSQGTYAQYLADALRSELELVKLHSATTTTVISGTLLKNDMDTGLAASASGVVEARFVVRRDGKVAYDRVKLARIEWETSFVGAVAIPRAQQEYARLVRTLLGELFRDPDFIAALK